MLLSLLDNGNIDSPFIFVMIDDSDDENNINTSRAPNNLFREFSVRNFDGVDGTDGEIEFLIIFLFFCRSSYKCQVHHLATCENKQDGLLNISK